MTARTILTMSLCFVLLGCHEDAQIPCDKASAEKAAVGFEQCIQMKPAATINIGSACGDRAHRLFCAQVQP